MSDEVNQHIETNESTSFAKTDTTAAVAASAETEETESVHDFDTFKEMLLNGMKCDVSISKRVRLRLSISLCQFLFGKINSEFLQENYEYSGVDTDVIDATSGTAATTTNTEAIIVSDASDDNENLSDYSLEEGGWFRANRLVFHFIFSKISFPFSEKKFYACDQCNELFARPIQLNSHKAVIHRTCPICDKRFKESISVKNHIRTHARQPYPCNFCHKSFSYANNLYAHKRTVHFGIRSYSCDECGRKFACNRNLQYHMSTHQKEKPYPCDQCHKSFPQPENLARHKKVIHPKVYSYVCNVCGRNFTGVSNLKRHQIQHTRKEPQNCRVCNISFKSEAILRNHKRRFHSRVRRRSITVNIID